MAGSGWKRDPDERVIWRSGKGGSVWWTIRISAWLIALGGLAGAIAMTVESPSDWRVGLVIAASSSIVAGFIRVLIKLPIGRAYVLTNRRLIRENHLTAPSVVPLSSIRGLRMDRVVNFSAHVVSDMGNCIVDHQGGSITLRDVADRAGLWRLITEGVLEHRLDLDLLPDLGDGEPVRSSRDDLFFADRCWAAHTRWGALLIGPTRIIRQGGERRTEITAGLRALVYSSLPAEQAEERVLAVVRALGGEVVLDRAEARLSIEGRELVVDTPHRKDRYELRVEDARRAAAFLTRHPNEERDHATA